MRSLAENRAIVFKVQGVGPQDPSLVAASVVICCKQLLLLRVADSDYTIVVNNCHTYPSYHQLEVQPEACLLNATAVVLKPAQETWDPKQDNNFPHGQWVGQNLYPNAASSVEFFLWGCYSPQ